MARRSVLNRFNRTVHRAYKAWLKKGRSWEAKIDTACKNYAGSKIVNKMDCCKGEGAVCLCQLSRDEMIRTHVACFPHKITQFKGEWAIFKEKIAKPSELTVQDVRVWPYMLVVGALLLWAGECIGRGSFYGYSFEEESK